LLVGAGALRNNAIDFAELHIALSRIKAQSTHLGDLINTLSQ